MKKVFIVAALGLSLVSLGALAHGPAKAQQGGIRADRERSVVRTGSASVRCRDLTCSQRRREG